MTYDRSLETRYYTYLCHWCLDCRTRSLWLDAAPIYNIANNFCYLFLTAMAYNNWIYSYR